MYGRSKYRRQWRKRPSFDRGRFKRHFTKRVNRGSYDNGSYSQPWNHSMVSTVSRQVGRPDKMFVKLKYNQSSYFGATTIGQQVFRLNSLYDPDYTGAGTQPACFDQWCPAIYNRYRVRGAYVQIDFVNHDSASVTNAGYVLGNNLTTWADNRWMTQTRSQSALLGHDGGANKTSMSFYVDLKDIYGISREQLATDDGTQAVYNANPTDSCLLTIVGSDAGLATNINLVWNCTITYYAELFDAVDVVDT